MEVARRRGRRRKKLLDDLKDRRGYSRLKEEALDRTMWRNRFGGGFGPVVRQNTEWMNECHNSSTPPPVGQSLLIFEDSRSPSYTPQSVGLLWTSDQPVAETSTWQQTTDRYPCPTGGIQTRNPSKRVAADPRLRPRGHWDRLSYYFTLKSTNWMTETRRLHHYNF